MHRFKKLSHSMNNPVGSISPSSRIDYPTQGSNSLLNLEKLPEPTFLEPLVNNEEDPQPANSTTASGILAIWEKALINQKRLNKYYYGPGAVHAGVTQGTKPTPSPPNQGISKISSNLDLLSSQIAHQAQEILDHEESTGKPHSPIS